MRSLHHKVSNPKNGPFASDRFGMRRQRSERRRWQNDARISLAEKPVEKINHFTSEACGGLRGFLVGVYVVPYALFAGAASGPTSDQWRGRHLPVSDLLEV